jgi:hypothetical protein
MSRPAILAVVAGALTFGWALGGMTTVDRDLAAAVDTAPRQTQTRFAADRGPDDHPGCGHDGGHHGGGRIGGHQL